MLLASMYLCPVGSASRDGGFGLEWIGHDLRFDDGFGALDQGSVNEGKQFGAVLEAVVTPAHAFEVEHDLHFPVVPLQGLVVVIRGQRWREKSQSHVNAQIHLGIARMLVEVDHIGMILGNGVIHPPHELVGKGRDATDHSARGVHRPVKVHRIHALPPFSFSVQNRLQRIVGHALLRPVLSLV